MGLGSFFGTYTPRLGDKGRITLPARYREEFSTGVMVVNGQDHCLYVFTPDGFAQHSRGVVDAPITDQRARGFQRFMLANTEQTALDTQGRITLPARMREYAGLVKDVVVLGVGHRLELWDAQAWADYEAAQEADYVDPSGDFTVS